MHDSRVSSNGTPYHIVCVCKVNDDDLVLFGNLLPHANEVVALERQRLHHISQI